MFDFLNREPNPKKILNDGNYAQTSKVFKMLEEEQKSPLMDSAEELNYRIADNNDYAMPILNSIENLFYFEDNFFDPNNEELMKDITMRKNAQNCLKILFDYTNLKFKDIFKLLTDKKSGCKLWIKNEKINPNKDAISIACSALGLDEIFKNNKSRFPKLKEKIEKIKSLKSYEQKATLFSKLVECNEDLQKIIFSTLKTEPCKYSRKHATRFAAKQAERKQKIAQAKAKPDVELSL